MECVVAMNQERVIGDGNKLLWHLPGDLKRLKSMTMGAPLIMGRKTFESIGKPLPGRANIVLTRSKTNDFDGAIVVNSFDEAITKAGEWIDQKKNNLEETIQQKVFLFGEFQSGGIQTHFRSTHVLVTFLVQYVSVP